MPFLSDFSYLDKMHQPRERIAATALILAGGRSSRLNAQDKGLVTLEGIPLILHTINKLKKQVKNIIICANRNISAYEAFGLPVISDEVAGYQGPLAGISVGMKKSTNPWLLVVPCDTPFIPNNLVERLYNGAQNSVADIAIAHDGDRAHYLHSLLKISLKAGLDTHLMAGKLSVNRWFKNHKLLEVDFSDSADQFHNINTQEDLLRAQKQMLTHER